MAKKIYVTDMTFPYVSQIPHKIITIMIIMIIL